MKPARFFFPYLLLSVLCCAQVRADEIKKSPLPTKEVKKEISPTLQSYLQLFKEKPKTFGPLGKWQNAEIEITLNLDQIHKIENQTRLRLLSKGFQEKEAEQWSSVGIVAEDNYWMWVRDAVTFPSGVYGTYDRLLWKSGLDGMAGVAVLPLLSNKKIIVNINYRHATRSWEIELPRGQSKEGELPEKTAARELREETGYQLSKCTLLGTMAPDSGTLMTLVPVFCAEVNHSGETFKEYSEAIVHNPAFSKEEIKTAFVKGYIEILIKGELVQVSCRDPFLSYAILLAEMKGLL